MSTVEQTYAEPLVARVLGPKKAVLVAARHIVLRKGRDWRLVDGVVHYTATGLTALCRHLKLDEQLVVGAAKNSPSEGAPATNEPSAVGAPGPAVVASAASGEASALGGKHELLDPKRPPAAGWSPGGPVYRSASMMTSTELAQFARRDTAETVAAAVTEKASRTEAVYIEVTGCSPNPLIVFGTLDGEAVKVRVRNNANFIRGLVLRARPSATGVYLMEGNPPRWKGDRTGFARPTSTPETSR